MLCYFCVCTLWQQSITSGHPIKGNLNRRCVFVCVCVSGLIPPRDYQCPVVQQIVYYILRQWENQTGIKNNNNTTYKYMYTIEGITDRGARKEEVEGGCSEKNLNSIH